MTSSSALKSLLKHARETIDECLPSDQSSAQVQADGLDGKVKEVLFAVSTAGLTNPRIELCREEKGDVWHIVVKLWVGALNEPWIAKRL